ncbi:unnamed protein product [Somion occarium]|uniref:F-box domain-containing protein n=1 Tax=Somion occarium TaxID=3059160 RepID=A0ABP1CLR7_9APHY
MSGPERIASHMRTLLQELSSPVLDRQLSLLFPGDMRSWIAQQRSYAFECTRLLNHLHNTTAPVYRLPTEALVNIFAIAITLPGSYTRELVLLTHVCHWWRDVALGASTLWTRIDPTCYCRLFLERSGNAPLSLDWYQEDIFSRVVTTIQPHILRFTSIKLTCRMKALKTFLGLLERYPPPMLQAVYLTCCGGYQIPEEPSIAFPTHGGSLGFSLASLTLIGLFICWESPIYDKLKHLHLIAESAIQPVPSMNVLLDVLERSPDLVTFRMLWRGPSLATLATTYLEPRHTVELARCRSIELQFPGIADVAHLLAHLRLPEFTHITISHINSTPIRDELLNILPRNPDLKPSNAVTQLQLRCANSDDVYNVSASGNGDHTGSVRITVWNVSYSVEHLLNAASIFASSPIEHFSYEGSIDAIEAKYWRTTFAHLPQLKTLEVGNCSPKQWDAWRRSFSYKPDANHVLDALLHSVDYDSLLLPALKELVLRGCLLSDDSVDYLNKVLSKRQLARIPISHLRLLDCQDKSTSLRSILSEDASVSGCQIIILGLEN